MILLANHKRRSVFIRGIEVIVDRGQIARGEATLASRWRWSRGKVRRFLCDLQTRQQIVQQKSRIITLITILNYNRYQPVGGKVVQQTEQQTGQQTVHKQRMLKNDKEEIPINSEKLLIKLPVLKFKSKFEGAWRLYPDKDGKIAAEKYYDASVKSDEDHALLLKAMKNYLGCDKVKNGYIKNGSTWFHNWKDWIEYKDPVSTAPVPLSHREPKQ